VGTSIKGQSGSLNVKVEVMAKVDGKFKVSRLEVH